MGGVLPNAQGNGMVDLRRRGRPHPLQVPLAREVEHISSLELLWAEALRVVAVEETQEDAVGVAETEPRPEAEVGMVPQVLLWFC